MTMHDFEVVTYNEDGSPEGGSEWFRRAVPGGWLYWSEYVLNHTFRSYSNGGDEREYFKPISHVEGAVFVPDPTAEHVVNAGKGEP